MAHATTLFTASGFVPSNHLSYCMLTNVGTTTAEVTNAVIGAYSGIEVTQSNSCFSTLAPGTSCWAYYDPGNKIDPVYCHFVASTSKVRGSLNVVDSNGQPSVTLPATK